MSASGSFGSSHTDAFTNGLNPMYQSVSQTEYDVIHHESQVCLVKPSLPPRVTTTNSVYSTAKESLKHPSLKSPVTAGKSSGFEFKSMPEMDRHNDNKTGCCGESSSCCFTLFMTLYTLISIVLSVSVIVVCVLHLTNVISIITPSAVVSNSSSNTTTNSTADQVTSNTTSCNCTDINRQITDYLEILTDIQEDFNNISMEVSMMENIMSLLADSSSFDDLSSHIQSINDSVQQLRIQATNTCSALSKLQSITEPVELADLGNQTCPVNVTDLDTPAGVTLLNIYEDECEMKSTFSCFVFPGTRGCTFQSSIGFFQDDKILTSIGCYLEFFSEVNGSIPIINGTAVVRQDSIFNTTDNQNIFNDVYGSNSSKHSLGCFCLTYDEDRSKLLACNYIAKFCRYDRGTVNSTIITTH